MRLFASHDTSASCPQGLMLVPSAGIQETKGLLYLLGAHDPDSICTLNGLHQGWFPGKVLESASRQERGHRRLCSSVSPFRPWNSHKLLLESISRFCFLGPSALEPTLKFSEQADHLFKKTCLESTQNNEFIVVSSTAVMC